MAGEAACLPLLLLPRYGCTVADSFHLASLHALLVVHRSSLPPPCRSMRADHNAELSFRDAMRFAIVDQLNAFRLASTKTDKRGQTVRQGKAGGVHCWLQWLSTRMG